MSQLPLDNMPFQFAVVDLHLTTKSSIFFDKYPGLICRSGFGAALKKLCLYKAHRVPCSKCRIQDSCPYSYIFETYKPGDRDIDFTAENFPHPFVFYPSITEIGAVRVGSELSLTLTLFCHGIDYLLFYIYAFDVLGDMGLGKSRGRYTLDSVVDNFSGNVLYSHHDKTLRGEPVRKTLADLAQNGEPETVQLDFATPTKIEHRSRTIDHLTPDILIRSLFRRASWLAERHQEKWHIDFKDLIDSFNAGITSYASNLELNKYERYSARQQRTQPLFAFTGSFTMKGQLSPFLPLMQLGSYMHVGKSTSQGLGKYVLKL
jgi:CRISPR-associated endoribonuclease Cas6